MNDNFWRALPCEFEVETYRSLNPDLAAMLDDDIAAHYENYGREEGRTSNRIRDRNDFVALIPTGADVLEIGPFCNPLLRRPNVNVFYFDVLPQDQLITRGKSIGLDPAAVPYIHYVSRTGDLSTINRRFDIVVSSHCIEHQPDLIGHLQAVGKLLLPGGAYFLLVPDKRYCFDHFIPESNLAEVMVAQREQRKGHTLRSVIEHRTLTTHNDSLRHWQGDHGLLFENFEQRFLAALREFDAAEGEYIDVHAWYFTPASASAILSALQDMRLSKLTVHRVYGTRYAACEFWMILRT